MIATLRSHRAASMFFLMVACGAGGCTPDSQSTRNAPEKTATAKQSTISTPTLPVRDFVQLPNVCPGSVHDLATLASGDVLVATAGASGQYALSIRAPGGTTTPLAPAAHYATRPTKVDVNGYRVVCAARAALNDRGLGPAGRVYSYDKSQGMQIVCWYSANGSTTWTHTVVAQAAPGEPTDAFWPFLYDEAETNDVVIPDAFDVVYVRDADYAPWVRTAAGRASREGTYFARVNMVTGLVSIYDHESYPDWTEPANEILGAADCSESCGYVSNGVAWTNCGSCGPGLTCNHGSCSPNSCAPLSAAQVCTDKLGAPACGDRSDGCGGIVHCSSCPAGTVCGGAGDPRHCGRRVHPMTARKLSEIYKDTDGRLCGTLQDPETGVPVTISSACVNCVDNICHDAPLPPCIPSGGL